MSTVRWLTPTSGYLQGYTHTLNPYTGCSFGCSYCYVRRLPVGMFRGEPWGSWVELKKGEPAKLQQEMSKAKGKGPVTVFFSSATDPYQPIEATAKVSRALLEAMADEPPHYLLLQTRSPLVVRDIDILQRLEGKVRVSMTIETDLDDVRRIVTPTTPPIAARVKALRTLREAGIEVQAAVSPILPHSDAFAEFLSHAAPRIVVDDYFNGDGSGGRRSESLGMRSLYDENGWSSWYNRDVIERLVHNLYEYFSEQSVGVSAEGFAPPH